MIDWSTAPEWARYAAMDESGLWYWYENSPEYTDSVWDSEGLQELVEPNASSVGDWTESWIMKPVTEPMTNKTMIDRSTAPEWAIGCAMDGDEKWFWYSEKPEHVEEDYGFWGVDGLFEIIYQDIPKVLNWRESWTPKPVTKPMTTEPMTTEHTIEHLTLGGQAPAIMPIVKLPVDDGGSAFPTHDYREGMSLRDYFAGQALKSLVYAAECVSISCADIAKAAYGYADAMLEARTK